MFFIILFLLLLTWLGYQDRATGSILQTDLLLMGDFVLTLRNLIIFTLTFALALTLKKYFREIAVAIVIFWTFATIGMPEIASLSGAVGFAGFSIFSQKPKNKISYMRKHKGRYVEDFI